MFVAKLSAFILINQLLFELIYCDKLVIKFLIEFIGYNIWNLEAEVDEVLPQVKQQNSDAPVDKKYQRWKKYVGYD